MTRADDTANERPPGQPAPGRPAREGQAQSEREGEGAEPQRIGYIGKRLGRFHIAAELGRGGMATVYRAHDPTVGRDVAVKVMHGFFAGRADIEARFRREANAVAAIRHPSILALYDFTPPVGEEPGYIVSEIIEGPGLRVLAEQCGGRLLPEVAAAIATRVAEALGAAHAAGIVHRDVKPDNIMIDRGGGSVRVVLTDFGVARIGTMETMTATGAVLGSPAFMSPEQARGDDVGPPSDVFSLGVLLYQLVTGHLPFSGKDPLALIAAILRGEYIRPGKLEARVGPELEQVIVRCLQREPAARFPDGRAVAAALREVLAASGFPDEEALLRRAMPDLDEFARATSPQIAERAVAAAEAARKRRQIPRALAEVGRALAYVPDQPVARALLDRLGSQRRSPWLFAGIGLVGAAAVAIVAAVALRAPGPKNAEPGTTASTVSAGPLARPVPRAVAAQPAAAAPVEAPPPAPEIAPAAPAAPTAHSTTQATTKPRTRAARRAVATTAPVAIPAPSTPEAAPAPAPVEAAAAPKPAHEEAPPPAAAAPTPTASINLRASHGFCLPSVDDSPPSLGFSANFSPGNHTIYCTLPQGGGKVKVGTYNLRPGTHPTLFIQRGDDEKTPTLVLPK